MEDSATYSLLPFKATAETHNKVRYDPFMKPVSL